MSEGLIQQAGRPQDVYRAPVNAFVANFIGTNNLVNGRVRACSGGRVALDSPLGTFDVPAPSSTLATGDKASFVVAADRVALASEGTADAAGRARVQGTVLGLEFVGSTQTVFIEVPGSDTEFRVQKQQHEIESLGLAPGQRVQLSWDPQHAWLLPQAA